MAALASCTAGAVGGIIYLNLGKVMVPTLLERLVRQSGDYADNLESIVESARSSLVSVRGTASVESYLDAVASGDTKAVRESLSRLNTNFLSVLAAHPHYLQLRLIGSDDGGREIVRAERSTGQREVRLVPPDQLQRKGQRDYFNETIGLGRGAIHFSPIELNWEHGELETPHVPVLRISTPVRTRKDEPFGILILNLDMGPILAQTLATRIPGSTTYVVNPEGDFLVHPDPARTYGWELGKRHTLRDEFPNAAPLIDLSQVEGRIEHESGKGTLGIATAPVFVGDRRLATILLAMPRHEMLAPISTVARSSLVVGALAAIGATCLALLLARQLTRPISQMTAAAEDLASGEAPLPLTAGGEVGRLARTFQRFRTAVREKTTALESEIAERRRAESAAQRSAEQARRLSTIIESSDHAIVSTARDGIITSWNTAAQTLLGLPAEHAIGQKIDMIFPPDLRKEEAKVRNRIAAGEQIEHHETSVISDADGTIDVSVTISAIREQTGTISGISFILQDITEKRQADQKLRLAVEASPSGIIMVDESRHIVLVNSGAEQMFGYSRDELLGRPIDILLPERSRSDHDSEVTGYMAKPQRRGMNRGREIHGRRKDGTEFPAEIGLNPIHTRDGLLVLSVVHDLTERRKIEAKQARLTHLLDASLSEIYMFHPETLKFEYVNQGARNNVGYSLEALLEMTPLDLKPEFDKESYAENLAPLLEKKVPEVTFESVQRRSDGQTYPVEAHLQLIEYGGVRSFIAVVNDISERKKAELERQRYNEELQRSNAELEQFAYVASHDLQEPLRMVASYTELLGTRYRGKLDEKADRFIHYAVDGAKRMQKLVNDLLTYSRVGRRLGEFRPVELSVVVSRVLRVLGPKITFSRASIKMGELPSVVGDELLLDQLFQNLLSNALKFCTERTPEIRIDAIDHAHEWEISLSDNGIGIDMTQADRLFQMFQRLHERGKFEGSGIGLAIVKKIIQLHEGRVWIESQIGQGTTIRFTFPKSFPERNPDESRERTTC